MDTGVLIVDDIQYAFEVSYLFLAEPKTYVFGDHCLYDLLECFSFIFFRLRSNDAWICSPRDELQEEWLYLIKQNLTEFLRIKMGSKDSFILKKLHKAECMDHDYGKILLMELQKILVFTLCNSRRNNFCLDAMDIDEVVDDASDIFAVLNLIEK